MLFLDRLHQHTAATPSKIAIDWRTGETASQLSYADLLRTISRAAGWLADHGVHAGDRVAICLPKGVAFIPLHLAACSLGAVSLPINPGYSLPELEYLLSDSEAKLLVLGQDTPQSAQDRDLGSFASSTVVAIDPFSVQDWLDPVDDRFDLTTPTADQTALMLYTSGTTGRPKGACMSHACLTANMDMLGEAWGWRADDTLLHVLPLFHVHGLLVALHGALHAGATCRVHGKFDAQRVLGELSDGDCTVFMGVPTIYRRLLDAVGDGETDLRHMRLMTSGSDRLPTESFLSIESKFGVRVVERYGMTETGIMTSNPLEGDRIAGQVGYPLPGVELRITDRHTGTLLATGGEGELQTRGPHVFSGYWRDAEKTAASLTEDGWFRTGDIGVRHQDGRYELKGRATDLIISGGLNVYPSEVEHVILAHADVAQCAVVGMPDSDWGEAVTAYVVSSGPPIDEKAIVAYCRRFLASYKTPKRVISVGELPRNAMGKVVKDRLREPE